MNNIHNNKNLSTFAFCKKHITDKTAFCKKQYNNKMQKPDKIYLEKAFDQIADLPKSFVLTDDIKSPCGNKLPLWMVGMMNEANNKETQL